MENGVYIWWIALSTTAVLNIGLWFYSARLIHKRKHSMNPAVLNARRWLLSLSGVYVLVCAIRSFLPRIDLERICLVDSWLSGMLVGRSLATVAELCFIIQCAILLREAGYATRLKTVILSFWIIVH